MAKSYYTRHELFILRNHVPVASLIEELRIPSKIIEGYFRFCCPVCHEFNTGINPKTNLARCFACQKNYNTIDLVMLVKGLNFINSVKLLQRFRDRKKEPACSNPLPFERPSSSQPISIGEILKTMGNGGDLVAKSQKENGNHSFNQLNDRIIQLEQKVEYLIQKIKVINPDS
jgi:DNA primase